MRQGHRKGASAAPKPQTDSRVTAVYRFRDFLAPVYWPAWLGIFGIYLMAWLPIPVRVVISLLMSRLIYWLVPSRRHTTLTNIRLCFAELSDREQKKLVRATFYSNTLTFFETAHAWCRPVDSMKMVIDGIEHYHQARETGKGILLLSGHFGPIDIGGALIAGTVRYSSVYRQHDNPLFNYFTTRARERYSHSTIARKDLKGLLRALREGEAVWYAPDQDYGRRASVFVPFFGIPTATITMTSKLAKSGNAIVLPLSGYRSKDCRTIHFRFDAPLPIPSGDDVEDARQINAWLESRIREHPEQYLWLHKRFKTRPEGQASLY